MSKRFVKDIKELQSLVESEELGGFTFDVQDNRIDFVFEGCGAYSKGNFKLAMDFVNFPTEAPDCRFETEIYHPSVGDDGYYCSALLSDWNSSTKISQLVQDVIDLFTRTVFPTARNTEAEELFSTNRALYQQKVKEWVQKFAQ